MSFGDNASDGSSGRRSSITQAAFSNLFQRNTQQPPPGVAPFPLAVAAATAMNDKRRRLSLSGAALGLPSTSAANALRRASLSTNASESYEENAIDDDDAASLSRDRRMSTSGSSPQFPASSAPRNARRLSATPHGMPAGQWQWMSAGMGKASAPDAAAATSAAASAEGGQAVASRAAATVMSNNATLSAARPDQGFNWPQQLRTRAESISSGGQRPLWNHALPTSPTASIASVASFPSSASAAAIAATARERTKSVADMPAPPTQAAAMRQRESKKPDHMQERILKGDFYMD